jgi:MFS family permease
MTLTLDCVVHGDGILLSRRRERIAVLLLVLSAIACYSMSLAPVTWVVISEIFPNRIRDAAMAIAVAALWLACFILTYTFPILNARLGAAGTFWLYAGICMLGLIFIWKKLPETKVRTLEEIEGDLTEDSHASLPNP